MTTTHASNISLASLPTLGADLEGGIFAGITTKKDGTNCAVIRLPVNGTGLTWKKAVAWAAKQGGELPSRAVAALLFTNVKASLPAGWHWTSEEDDASCAWGCTFLGGTQFHGHKSYVCGAVAVRLIPLTA